MVELSGAHQRLQGRRSGNLKIMAGTFLKLDKSVFRGIRQKRQYSGPFVIDARGVALGSGLR